MRIAAIYDVHGNLPALEAVVAEIRSIGVDEIIVGGDLVPGPLPRETFDFLRSIEIPARFITGNCDHAVLDVMQGREPTSVPPVARPLIEWSAGQLDKNDETLIASWPSTLTLSLPSIGNVMFCHATPRNDTDTFTRDTAEEKLMPIFHNTTAQLVVCGHTHMQFDRIVGRTRVVNAGSVGMPFGKPGAYWLLLGPAVELGGNDED